MQEEKNLGPSKEGLTQEPQASAARPNIPNKLTLHLLEPEERGVPANLQSFLGNPKAYSERLELYKVRMHQYTEFLDVLYLKLEHVKLRQPDETFYQLLTAFIMLLKNICIVLHESEYVADQLERETFEGFKGLVHEYSKTSLSLYAIHSYFSIRLSRTLNGINKAAKADYVDSKKTYHLMLGMIKRMSDEKLFMDFDLGIDYVVRALYSHCVHSSDKKPKLTYLLTQKFKTLLPPELHKIYDCEIFLLMRTIGLHLERIRDLDINSSHYMIYRTTIDARQRFGSRLRIEIKDLHQHLDGLTQDYRFCSKEPLLGLIYAGVAEKNISLQKVLLSYLFRGEIFAGEFEKLFKCEINQPQQERIDQPIEAILAEVKNAGAEQGETKKRKKKRKKKKKGRNATSKSPRELHGKEERQVESEKAFAESPVKDKKSIVHPDLAYPENYSQGISHYKQLAMHEAEVSRQCLALCYAYICGQKSKIKEADRRALLFKILSIKNRVSGPEVSQAMRAVMTDLEPGGFYAPKMEFLEIPVEDPEVQNVIDALESEFHVFDHGGSIRNTLLGIPVNDHDVLVDADIDAVYQFIMSMQAKLGIKEIKLVGNGVKIILLTLANSEQFEITVLRNQKNKNWPLHIALRDNVLQRDFTMNALFRDRQTKQVLDYGTGLADIERKRFVTVNVNAEKSFKGSFIRVLRLMYYRAQFSHHGMQFGCAKSINATIRNGKYKSALDPRTKIHVYYLFNKMLHADFAEEVLQLLKETKILYFILPCLNKSNVNLFIKTVLQSQDLSEVDFWVSIVSKVTGDLDSFLKDAAFTMKPALMRQIQTELESPFFESPISSASAESGRSSPSSEPTSPTSSHSGSSMSTSPD